MKKSWYAVLTADVLYSDELTDRQKLLYAVASNLANETGFCFASNEHFAKMLKCSVRSIQRDVKKLTDLKYFKTNVFNQNGVQKRKIFIMTFVSHHHDKFVADHHDTGVTHNNKVINNKDNKSTHTLFSDVKQQKKKTKFQPPTLQDVIKYFDEKGYSKEAAKRAFEYYETGDWKDSTGKQVKNWKQKMFSVWFKPENKKEETKSNVFKGTFGS